MEVSMARALKVPDLALRDALLFDVTCALPVHAIYKHFEPDTARLFVHFLLLIAVPSLPAACFLPHFPDSAALATFSAFSLFYFSLATSILLYRLSPWHPLAKYPGPILAKLSKFWAVFVMAKGKNHIYHKELHAKYGPYVRVGPNELSVVDVYAIPSILGPDGMPKGPMWSVLTPPPSTPSLIALRLPHEHARRRKPWTRAFNPAAVRDYEPIVQKRVLQLVGELEKLSVNNTIAGMTDEANSVNLAAWLRYFTTDFMGDMAFGGGFELMRDGGDKEGIWTIMESGAKLISTLHHIPWAMPLLFKVPGAMENTQRFRVFSEKRVRARRENGSLERDLFYHLIDEDGVEKVPPTEEEIISDGGLAIVAGSDTTATVLSGLFCFLLRHPQEYVRLQKEVDVAFPFREGDPFDTKKLAEMPFLNAVINEAMRLQPPVASCLQRASEAGSGGKWISDHLIPEGTAVFVPPYALFRSPSYFSPAPDAFWPDRWLVKQMPLSTDLNIPGFGTVEKSEVITNTAAFIPFSYGPKNCAGRALALTEMRMVVAILMQRFEIRFADGYNSSEWEEHLEGLLCDDEWATPCRADAEGLSLWPKIT